MKVMSHDKIILSRDKGCPLYLVFHLIMGHHLNACDITTLACDKVVFQI